jgi:4-carboxymuconolactone decarboxylase
MDAPTVSYALNLSMAGQLELELGLEEVRGVLTAIAPIVGTPRVASATGHIVEAVGIALEVASAEQAAAGDL